MKRLDQGVHRSLGVEGERGNAPPPAPAGTREAWPQGVGWLYRLSSLTRSRQRCAFGWPRGRSWIRIWLSPEGVATGRALKSNPGGRMALARQSPARYRPAPLASVEAVLRFTPQPFPQPFGWRPEALQG